MMIRTRQSNAPVSTSQNALLREVIVFVRLRDPDRFTRINNRFAMTMVAKDNVRA